MAVQQWDQTARTPAARHIHALIPSVDPPPWNMNGYMKVMESRNQMAPLPFLAIREPQILVLRSRGGDSLEDWQGDAVRSKLSSQTVDSFGGILCYLSHGNQRDIIKQNMHMSKNVFTYKARVFDL
jgi:hypothetical protein